ncbi:hypothetical protein P7D98_18635 [Enterococcus avium]|uniref:YobI family P-loop NTPase n=1 Tax=Enterococcus avium TaxID=33945 RepID=UPI00288E55FA|nr:hypothetical protein [Enterococcus avium]MDT2467684.1 hypothetical protein [Enterococcus avium]MDT2507089.1 hypothetical protein [Enterococcus avium]
MGEESSSENQKVVSNKLTNIEKGQLGLKDRFKKLTPEKNLDEKGLSGYKEALDYAFSDEDINNIALTGVYGSGKSSVLESYKKKSDRKFLHISLAHFDDRNDEDYELKATDEVSIPFEKKTIEGKILNQLLHQINAKEIPQTIFRTKKKINKKSVCLATAMFILTLISLIVILNIEPWFSSLKEIFFLLLGLVRIIPIPSKKSVDIIAIIMITSI